MTGIRSWLIPVPLLLTLHGADQHPVPAPDVSSVGRVVLIVGVELAVAVAGPGFGLPSPPPFLGGPVLRRIRRIAAASAPGSFHFGLKALLPG